MNKKFIADIMAFLAISLTATAQTFAGIKGSNHDFTRPTDTWNNSGEICFVCHIPHSATSTIAPLWNHKVTTSVFKVYSSPSLTATVGQPSASSKACLSCHDGTVAKDAFGGRNGSEDKKAVLLVGEDLSDDHPISFTYDSALANKDAGLYDPNTKTVGAMGGKTIKNSMLINNKVECSSCHDVHRAKGDSAGPNLSLLVNNRGSALCLTCHKK